MAKTTRKPYSVRMQEEGRGPTTTTRFSLLGDAAAYVQSQIDGYGVDYIDSWPNAFHNDYARFTLGGFTFEDICSREKEFDYYNGNEQFVGFRNEEFVGFRLVWFEFGEDGKRIEQEPLVPVCSDDCDQQHCRGCSAHIARGNLYYCRECMDADTDAVQDFIGGKMTAIGIYPIDPPF